MFTYVYIITAVFPLLTRLYSMPAARLPIKALLSAIKRHSALIDGTVKNKFEEIYRLYIRFYAIIKQKKFLGEIQAAKTKMPIEKSSCLTECPLILTNIYGGIIRIEMACNRRYMAINEDEVDYMHCACLELTWCDLKLEFWTEKDEQCAKRLKRIPTHLRLLCQNNHSLGVRNDGTFVWDSMVIMVQKRFVLVFQYLLANTFAAGLP